MGLFGRLNRRSRARRVLLAAAVITVVTWAASCTESGLTPRPPSTTAWRGPACDLPSAWVERIARGTQTGGGRGSDLIVVAQAPNYVGTKTDAGHSGPIEHLQEIPLVFYGPGHIRSQGDVSGPATLASVAPTLARLLDFNLEGTDESPLHTALLPNQDRPRLIVTAVVDGGGLNVLRHWPSAWPHIAELMEEGTSFVDATVGSSPTITPSSHASLGTGVYPRTHGVTGIVVRNEGRITGAFTKGPRRMDPYTDPTVTLEHPTLAELFDRAEDNAPTIALVGFGNFVLGMIGRGAGFPGGDKDIAMYTEDDRWIAKRAFFKLPAYVAGRDENTDEDLEEVDRIDGVLDGKWRGHAMEPVMATPAFSARIERTISSIIVRENMGADTTPDMLFVNFKPPDYAGHLWNMTAPEQKDALASVDEAIGSLTDLLDSRVGRGNWVLALTADHGQTPIDEESWPISMLELRNDTATALDHVNNGAGLFDQSTQALLFMDEEELETNDLTPEHIASFISEYTLEENVAESELPAAWEDRAAERLFAAAFPVRRLHEVVSCTRTSKMPADDS